MQPQFNLELAYVPGLNAERSGDVLFRVWPLASAEHGEKPLAEGKAAVGARFNAGRFILSAKEIRYWVGISVRFDPGKPIVLTSLWIGLGGMVITTIGRMTRRKGGTL